MAVKPRDDAAVFAALKGILKPYARHLHIAKDTPTSYYLETKAPAYKGKPLMIAAVITGKAYTSFHLIPIYLYPEFAANLSPELAKRRQGKACFNFTQVDKTLFAELAQLTKASFTHARDANFAVAAGSG